MSMQVTAINSSFEDLQGEAQCLATKINELLQHEGGGDKTRKQLKTMESVLEDFNQACVDANVGLITV